MSKGAGRRVYPKLLKSDKGKHSPGDYNVPESLPNTFSNIQKKVKEEKKIRNKVKRTKNLIRSKMT